MLHDCLSVFCSIVFDIYRVYNLDSDCSSSWSLLTGCFYDNDIDQIILLSRLA